ncbi:MAG: glycosyltransferase family 10 [Candidatus Falkowbacteria bacterium]
MKKIKLSFPATTMRIEKQSPGFSAIWGDCQFFINQDIDDCDFWVVCEHLLSTEESTVCPPGNTIFITGEPNAIWHYDKNFVKQFAKVVTCQREIKGPGVIYSLQGHPWHVGLNHSNPDDLGLAKSYDELVNMKDIPKTKLLSIVTSDKQGTVGHRQRYRFALGLKNALGDQVDLFGRGINDFNDKWDVLAPYKYSIAIENCATDDYVSEKLTDCFLAHTFPFYYGAPNVESYFLPDAYCLIDIHDLAGSIERISSIINDTRHYEDHIMRLIEAKMQYLNHYNIFPLIAGLVNTLSLGDSKEKIVLKNINTSLSFDNRIRIVKDKLMLVCDKLIHD